MRTAINLVAVLLVVAAVPQLASALELTNSVTINGMELQILRQEDPVQGLESYLIRAVANNFGLNMISLEQPAIDGVVHQCEHTYDAELQPTILLAQIREGEDKIPSWTDSGWTNLHTATDTHLILSDEMETLFIFGPDPPIEGNNGANPFGLDTNGGLTRIGLGEITASTDYTVGTWAYSGSDLDIMQVVIPSHTAVHFTGLILGTDEEFVSHTAYFENVTVGVPEPGTLLLLLCGVLSLISMRRRG